MRVVISSIQQNLKNQRIKEVFHVKSCDQLADVFTKSNVNTDGILNVIQKNTLLKQHDQMSIDRPLEQNDNISDEDFTQQDQRFKTLDVEKQDQRSDDLPS